MTTGPGRVISVFLRNSFSTPPTSSPRRRLLFCVLHRVPSRPHVRRGADRDSARGSLRTSNGWLYSLHDPAHRPALTRPARPALASLNPFSIAARAQTSPDPTRSHTRPTAQRPGPASHTRPGYRPGRFFIMLRTSASQPARTHSASCQPETALAPHSCAHASGIGFSACLQARPLHPV